MMISILLSLQHQINHYPSTPAMITILPLTIRHITITLISTINSKMNCYSLSLFPHTHPPSPQHSFSRQSSSKPSQNKFSSQLLFTPLDDLFNLLSSYQNTAVIILYTLFHSLIFQHITLHIIIFFFNHIISNYQYSYLLSTIFL